MTKGDWIRKIKKESLREEIKRLERIVHEIRCNDLDSTDEDPDVQAYQAVIAEKKAELENL